MKVCKYILASAQIRFIIGSTIIGIGVGIGGGLVASAFIHVPEE